MDPTKPVGVPGADDHRSVDAVLGSPDEWIVRNEATREFVASAVETVASLVRTTYGPKGSESLIRTVDKQDQPETVLTADADEIIAALERLEAFNHPVAAILVDALDSLRRGLSDGTTTALLLSAALVREGVALVEEGVHPGSVVVGYAIANARAGEVLDELAREVGPEDVDALRDVAATAMAGADDAARRDDDAATIAAVTARLARGTDRGWIDTDDVRVLGHTAVETDLVEGVVLRREPASYQEMEAITTRSFERRPAIPEPIDDATVAIVDDEIDFEETATDFEMQTTSEVALSTREDVTAYTEQLEARTAEAAERLRDLGVDVLVVQERVEDPVQRAFERAGVAVIERAKYPYEDGDRLAEATGARVVSYVEDLDEAALGTAGRVSDRLVGDEKWATVEGCDGVASTLVVGAKTETTLRQRERRLSDALDVAAVAASDRQVLPGAGAPAMAVARGVREYATSVAGREQLAVEAFADAVETLPRTLAGNAGHDPVDAVTALRNAHADGGPAPVGLDIESGDPVDAWRAGVVEPRRVFSQAVETAAGVTEQLLTVDAVLLPEVDLDSFDPMAEHE